MYKSPNISLEHTKTMRLVTMNPPITMFTYMLYNAMQVLNKFLQKSFMICVMSQITSRIMLKFRNVSPINFIFAFQY